MTRTRSEYRRHGGPIVADLPADITVVSPLDLEPTVLATLLLDAYRGTIDDEGEDDADALAAIVDYATRILPDHSIVLLEDGVPVAMSFVVTVDDVHYIDPVATASSAKRRGLGGVAAGESLRRLQHAGIVDVGATITDGNTASERLFARLGFQRVGLWC